MLIITAVFSILCPQIMSGGQFHKSEILMLESGILFKIILNVLFFSFCTKLTQEILPLFFFCKLTMASLIRSIFRSPGFQKQLPSTSAISMNNLLNQENCKIQCTKCQMMLKQMKMCSVIT